MNEYLIGVDGGGTKTAVVLVNNKGKVLGEAQGESISYREHGIPCAVHRLWELVQKTYAKANLKYTAPKLLAVGAPGYGENPEMDCLLYDSIQRTFPCSMVALVNDVVVGFYAALSGKPGIDVVAGTGGIAYGEDAEGHSARSSGWSEHFTDEGSCYWLGRMTMSLFAKEADGREERGALYEVIRNTFNLSEDMAFVSLMEKEYLPDRTKVASLQRQLLEAAKLGDKAAIALYDRAAWELCNTALAVKKQLELPDGIPVSLTGGLTHARSLVLNPFEKYLNEYGMSYYPAEGSPSKGAAILAMKFYERYCKEE